MLRILHACGIDMEQADEDGISPVHTAAANGNLDVLKFMHENGVNLEAQGAIYLDTDEDGSLQLHSSVTPLTRLLKAVLRDPRRSAQTFSVSWKISARHLNSQKNGTVLLFLPTIGRCLSVSLIGCGTSLLRCRYA